MQQFQNEEEHLKFLRLKLHEERNFIQGYYELTRQQVIYLFAGVLNKEYKDSHISKLTYEEICKCFDYIRALTLAARNGEGRRIPKSVKNCREYGKQLREEQKCQK